MEPVSYTHLDVYKRQVHAPDVPGEWQHILYSCHDNGRLSDMGSDLCLHILSETHWQILPESEAPPHGYLYEIPALHVFLFRFRQ